MENVSKSEVISIVENVEYPIHIEDDLWNHIQNNKELVIKTVKAAAEMVKTNILEKLEKL